MSPATVFISHKKEDSGLALKISEHLKKWLDTYLDVLDPHVAAGNSGEDLGDYVRTKLDACTHLLAVLTRRTQESWWVPFEIGIATEKDYPISTFAGEDLEIPEYLKKWPYLTSLDQLDRYAIETMGARVHLKMAWNWESRQFRREYAREFHKSLKASLKQS